jgi:hypothetical protein
MLRGLAGVILLASSIASAAPRRILLQPLRFAGPVAPAEEKMLQERVFDTVELLLSQQGDELVHREEVMAEVQAHPELKDCAQPRCLLSLGDHFKAERVLTIFIERGGAGKRADWTVHVDQFLIDTAHDAPATELPCQGCAADKLLGDLSHLLDPLLMPKPLDPVCRVSVSAPPGTEVQLDGTPLGAAPFSHSIAAGHHEVAAGKLSRAIDCTAGGEVQVSLMPEVSKPPPLVARRRSPALKILGASLIVLGVAGVIAGGVDLARNGEGTCDKAPGQKRCPEVYDTFVPGAALTALGVAGVAAGGAVLAVDALRSRPRAYVSVGRDFALLTVGGEL